MNKKQNHISARQAAEKAVIRDEQNRRIRYAATNPVPEVLKELHTTFAALIWKRCPPAGPGMAATR